MILLTATACPAPWQAATLSFTASKLGAARTRGRWTSKAPATSWTRLWNAAFNGWSIFAVRNAVRDATGAAVVEASQSESPLTITELAQSVPGSDYAARNSIAGLAALGEVRPADRTHVWVIAEPRTRGAGAVEWKDGSPVTASDAIVLEFQIGVP